MKQGILLDVPPMGASKASQITAFKKEHRILTHRSNACHECRWMAVKVPPRRLDNNGPIEGMSLFDMAANFCRLLDEGGWTGYGTGELSAIRDLCKTRGIPCEL